MYDQSFCIKTLERTVRKSDFDHVLTPPLKEAYRLKQIDLAYASAYSSFNQPLNPLESFPLKGKLVYRFKLLPDELVARKLFDNLKRFYKRPKQGRSQIVQCLNLLLAEGTPFRVYRLDIKSFYESFDDSYVTSAISGHSSLSPHSKSLMLSLLESHKVLGGSGIPRGLSLSALLAEILMRSFDIALIQSRNVFYYARYVDDIIVITAGKEHQKVFLNWIQTVLPRGLKLNTLKQIVEDIPNQVKFCKEGVPTERLSFDYLGYSFTVRDPLHIPKSNNSNHYHRHVVIDIAGKKIAKIKTRIIRALMDYSRFPDWDLLRDRLKFLRQNFSVHNRNVGSKKLAGIYHSYPELSADANGLLELDQFLRHAVLSKSGRVCTKLAALLSQKQKRELLSQSFVTGHQNKTFVHFTGQRIKLIQHCWKY